MNHYSIKICQWCECKRQLSEVRRNVFIKEQKVPEKLEWDEFDVTAKHVMVLTADNRAIASGRIKEDGHIGRMAVLKGYRQQGIGSKILLALLDIATQKKLDKVYLHAQVTAILFYEKHGFTCIGKQFLDAGIPHQSMFRDIK